MSSKHKNYEFALEVKDVSKIFKIPHRKIDSVRGAFVNVFRKNYYEEFKALDDVSFNVKRGEFLGIIGHNGAGKSTLLKILAGIYKPTKGNIKIHGRISPFLELGIGFNPELSGRDNVYLNATVLGLTKKQIDEKFDEIISFAGLEDFVDQQIKNYSSGMQVRLAFSVSIHANRDILLMDEVLAVGDSAFQEKCLDIFKNYKSQGRTVILVTHSMSTVREYCDRALLLDRGQILDIGNVDEVCDQYIFNSMNEEERKELEKKEELEKEEKEKKEEIREEIKKTEMTKEDWRQKRLKKYGNKIKKIRLLDAHGKRITRIRRGEDFIVEVVIDVQKPNNHDILAVQIIDRQKDCIICGNNTRVDNFVYDWKKGENKIELVFLNNPLNKGDVYLKIMLIRRRKKMKEVLDEYIGSEESEYIKIDPVDDRAGVVYMEHKWIKE